MGIRIPSYHLKSQWSLPSFRSRVSGPLRGRTLHSELNLTAMIDIFSTIILFLVSTFSATGDVMLVNPAIQLPTAIHGFQLNRSPIVTVTEQEVSLEGAEVGSNKDIRNIIRESDWQLPLMKEKLRAYKQEFENAQPGLPFPGEIILQADKKLSFLFLKRVMYTLVQEGYTGISLVVGGEATKFRDPNAPVDTSDAGAR